MVSDDDTEPRDPHLIPSDPVTFTDPKDDKISRAVEELARREKTWGRRQILRVLRGDGHELKQEHVNFVLKKHNLPNLHRN